MYQILNLILITCSVRSPSLVLDWVQIGISAKSLLLFDLWRGDPDFFFFLFYLNLFGCLVDCVIAISGAIVMAVVNNQLNRY